MLVTSGGAASEESETQDAAASPENKDNSMLGNAGVLKEQTSQPVKGASPANTLILDL